MDPVAGTLALRSSFHSHTRTKTLISPPIEPFNNIYLGRVAAEHRAQRGKGHEHVRVDRAGRQVAAEVCDGRGPGQRVRAGEQGGRVGGRGQGRGGQQHYLAHRGHGALLQPVQQAPDALGFGGVSSQGPVMVVVVVVLGVVFVVLMVMVLVAMMMMIWLLSLVNGGNGAHRRAGTNRNLWLGAAWVHVVVDQGPGQGAGPRGAAPTSHARCKPWLGARGSAPALIGGSIRPERGLGSKKPRGDGAGHSGQQGSRDPSEKGRAHIDPRGATACSPYIAAVTSRADKYATIRCQDKFLNARERQERECTRSIRRVRRACAERAPICSVDSSAGSHPGHLAGPSQGGMRRASNHIHIFYHQCASVPVLHASEVAGAHPPRSPAPVPGGTPLGSPCSPPARRPHRVPAVPVPRRRSVPGHLPLPAAELLAG